MNPADWIVVAVIVLVVGLAGWYIYRAKKNGRKCIGCPDSDSCSGYCNCCNRDCSKDR